MEIGFCVFREVKVDDDVDGLDVDSSRKEICADEIATDSVAEVVEDAVAMGLEHFGVRVEAGVSAFCDSFGEEFHSICGVAENNGLVDL